MRNRSIRMRCLRFATAIAVGGSAFQLSGCDPAVRDSLLGGLEETTSALSNALISAFFISLENNASSSGGSLTTTGQTP